MHPSAHQPQQTDYSSCEPDSQPPEDKVKEELPQEQIKQEEKPQDHPVIMQPKEDEPKKKKKGDKKKDKESGTGKVKDQETEKEKGKKEKSTSTSKKKKANNNSQSVPVPSTQPETHSVSSSTVSNNTHQKKPVYKIGPKSKTLAAKQYSQIDDLDDYKCTITVHENGSMNGYGVLPSHPLAVKSNSSMQPGDSSDSEVSSEDGTPIFAQLRPAKRRRSQSCEGVFIGPKRVKQARLVRERQERRHRSLQEQLRQSELEEEIQAIRIEKSNEEAGPLGNMLVKSSIILADTQMEEPDNVEQCIATIKAEQLGNSSSDAAGDLENGDRQGGSGGQTGGGAKRARKSHTSKVFHNENSVIIKHLPPPDLSKRKLRAKDFKWSHYIKSMRYWCPDCAHGFKNQKEVSLHTEERCKWNCLYMLECYVIVKDVQYHAHYGPKVRMNPLHCTNYCRYHLERLC